MTSFMSRHKSPTDNVLKPTQDEELADGGRPMPLEGSQPQEAESGILRLLRYFGLR